MKALLLALKKVITVITAILVPASSATPAVVHSRNVNPQANTVYMEVQEVEAEPQYEIVTFAAAPDFEAADEEDSIAEPISEEPDEEVALCEEAPDAIGRDEEFAPVETWDVSATDDDDVMMAFYDTEDVDALLQQLVGRIGGLFTPMVAYAAENERTITENDERITVNEGNSTVVINKENLVTTGNQENGEDPYADLAEEERPGTVVVSGTGDMMEYVYNYFVSPEKYVATAQQAFLDEYGLEVVGEYDHSLTDVVEIDATIRWRIAGTDEYVGVDDKICEALNPENMLDYSPTTIIIANGVTNISDYAFAFCAEIERVVIPATVTEIGDDAFAYCRGLTEINLPAGLEKIGVGAFEECTGLERIELPASLTEIGTNAFDNIGENSVIVCPNNDIRTLVIESKAFDANQTTLVLAQS